MDDGPRRGRRLDPDPRVHEAIVAAATDVIREHGVQSLSVAQVLDRAGLGTRAFYRHFESKHQLVAAVFLDQARAEARRLRKRMATATDPVDGVVAWIDGRLDLAFSDHVESELRQLSLEAQSLASSAPDVVGTAYAAMLDPLIEQLERGRELGRFVDVDPSTAAILIQGALWANVERQWATGDCSRDDVRRHLVQFCLRGLGVRADAVAARLSTDYVAVERQQR